MQQMQAARYEIKLDAEPHHLHQIQAWVRLHPAHWRVTFPPRQVNNIYFDTFDYQCLNDNLSGVGQRRKLRLRWYGPQLETVSGAQLELKCKQGLVGWKEICYLESLVLDLVHQPWSDLHQRLRRAADARANLWLGQFPHPVLINHYQRIYYATPDESVRLTIDAQLYAYDQRLSTRPNLGHPSPISDRVIVELKADRRYHSQLEKLLAQFPIRTDRYSKYVQGMLAAVDFERVQAL